MLKPPTLPEPPKPLPPIEEAVKTRALENLKKLAKGNGIHPDKISIESAEAKTLSFEAHAFVRLTTEFKSRTEAGKSATGEPIGSYADFERAMKSMTFEAQRNPGKRKTIIDAVLKRTDKGFGAKEQILKVEGLSRDFVSYEGCGACGQSGQTTCSKCGGQKHMTCQTCHGRQNIICPNCRGRGSLQQNGKNIPCSRCHGRTRIACPNCGARGQIPCKGCGATGVSKCGNCKGTGWLSHLAHVEMINHLHFNYERQGLPIELSKMLDAFGARHAAEKDLEITPQITEYQENEPPETIPVHYQVRVPFGEMSFKLGKQKIGATVMGWQGKILRAPEFLDELTKKGQVFLEKASSGQGNVGSQIRNAARYRLLREIIILAASQPPQRKAMAKIMPRYPVGISSDKVLQFFMQASHALQIITRKPKLIGLGIGSLIFSVIAAGYFISARDMILPMMVGLPFNPLYAIDAAMIPLGAFCAVLGAQLMAKQSLKKTLNGLAKPDVMKRIMPKAGWTLWAGLVIAAFITGGLYVALVIAP